MVEIINTCLRFFREKPAIFSAILFLATVSAESQNDVHFEHISDKQGLSQGSVWCILQDKNGFMWFGTQDGLNRYDGISMKVYRNNPLDTTTLSDNFVTALGEDFNNNLWIGTQNGLNKLSKTHIPIKRFYLHSQFNDEQNTISITTLFVEKENRTDTSSATIIWIGTFSGLFRFNTETEQFTQFHHSQNEDSSLSNNAIRCIYRDTNNNLWIGTDVGLNRKVEGTDKFVPYSSTTEDSAEIMNHAVCQVLEDSHHRLWILGEWNTYFVVRTPSGNTSHRIPAFLYSNGDSIYTRHIYAIREDSSGNFWLGTPGWGLTKIALSSDNTPSISLFLPDKSDPNSLSSDFILSLFIDRSNILWLGTFGMGVEKANISNPKFPVYRYNPGNANSLCTESIRGIYEDENDILWLGGYNFINCFDRKKKECSVIKTPVRNVYTIYGDPVNKDILWLGTEGGGLIRFNKSNHEIQYSTNDVSDISGNWVNSLLTDTDGTLWAGTDRGVVERVTYNSSGKLLFKHYPLYTIDSGTARIWLNVITKDRFGILWIGTQGKGLYTLDPKSPTGDIHSFPGEPGNPKRLGSDRIKTIFEDSHGTMWIGTDGGGIHKYNREDSSFQRFTEYDGLPNNVVYGILEDKSGNLWLSTNKGISKFNPATHTFRNYDANDGLQSNEFNSGSYYKCKHGEMFFGGVKGLNAFFPEEIKDNQNIPQIAITSFKKFNEEVNFDKPVQSISDITLSYDENFISFEFAALEFTAPIKNQYAYRMEGFDKDWVYTGNKNSATFTNLDPGNYTFHVKASNNDGVWNEKGIAIAITITPPYWKTLWFRGLIAGAVCSIISGIFFIRIKRLEKENKIIEEFSRKVISELENERKRVAGEIHDGLGQYLLVVKNRAEIGARNSTQDQKVYGQFQQISIAATEAIKESRQISHNLRPYQLDRLGLADAIRSMLEKARETSLINFTGSIDDINNLFENNDIEIHLYRIVQESVNNILKHSSATTARIVIERKEQEVVLLIEDNGVGFDSSLQTPAQQGGMGMSTMTERIRIIHGTSSFHSSRNEGTKLEVHIPIKQS